MGVTVARDLQHALDALADDPSAHLLAGGTDFMVEVNFGHRQPAAVVDITRVPELAGWSRAGADLVLGAGLTYRQMEESDLRATLPALVDAARTVGSPQIRGAGTLGGNLGTGSPAGDTLPVLAALDAARHPRVAFGHAGVAPAGILAGAEAHRARAGRDHRRGARARRSRSSGVPQGRDSQLDGDRRLQPRARR